MAYSEGQRVDLRKLPADVEEAAPIDGVDVLELSVARQPGVGTIDYLVAAAHALAYVLIASRRHHRPVRVRVDAERTLAATAERHPRQIVQKLARNVLQATGGTLLDDATAVCIEWCGPAGNRHATGGASRARLTVS